MFNFEFQIFVVEIPESKIFNGKQEFKKVLLIKISEQHEQ